MDKSDIKKCLPTETETLTYWVNSLYMAGQRLGEHAVASLTNRLWEAINERDKARFEQSEIGSTALDESNRNS